MVKKKRKKKMDLRLQERIRAISLGFVVSLDLCRGRRSLLFQVPSKTMFDPFVSFEGWLVERNTLFFSLLKLFFRFLLFFKLFLSWFCLVSFDHDCVVAQFMILSMAQSPLAIMFVIKLFLKFEPVNSIFFFGSSKSYYYSAIFIF